MGLKLVIPPALEPVSLVETKAHLRLDTDIDDGYVSALIKAARERAEIFLRRALMTQTFEYTIDGFPASRHLDLPRPPLQLIESIQYIDSIGNPQILLPEIYLADTSSDEIGRVALACSQVWPVTNSSINAVVIRFVAGYGNAPASVPQAIRHGILMEIANLYENREDIVIGQSVNMLPVSERLLWPYRALTVE